MSAPQVIVDDREPHNTAQRLCDYGVGATISHMEVGDYLFFPHGKMACIERKTISDLLSSIASKRLVSQAHRMIKEYEINFILREGEFRRDGSGTLSYLSPRDPRADAQGWVQSGWNWDSFTGMMLDLQLMGIDFIDCPVMGDYPREIARLVTNVCADSHRWIQERERPDITTIDKQYANTVWSWCAYDGVGPETAEALLSVFGSSYKLMDALVNDPQAVIEAKVGTKSFGKRRTGRLQDEVMHDWRV